MALNFSNNSHQSDWELFPPQDDKGADEPSIVTSEQVQGDNPYPRDPLAPSKQSSRHYRHYSAGGHGSLNWTSTATTPTQSSHSVLSNYFGNIPEHPVLTSALNTAMNTAMAATTPAKQGHSPSSSPRLPSPPPYTEVQIGPKSPSIGGINESDHTAGSEKEDDGSLRRIRPGTKAADMSSGPPLVPLAQLDSPFQLQEHLKALYHTYTKSADGTTTTPITRVTAMALATPPEGIDRQLWLYELCRFLTMKANNLIIAFFAENPPCSAETCPEMRASEWQYLCAVHEPPKSCCAIDYCCHTLDWATNVLTSPKYFPSRLTLGSEAAGGAQTSMRYLTNIFRRVYRIFAHAWFQHRGVFWEVEGHDGLYVFFKTVCDAYALIGEDNYTIPAEAEGHEVSLQTPISNSAPEQPMILKKNDPQSDNRNGTDSSRLSVPDQEPTTISTGATTRRHKHTPSTGTNVTTIAEGEEEESNERPDEQEVSSTATAPVEDESKELVENAASLGDGVANISSEAEPIKTDETDATADDEHKEAAETPMEPSLQNEYAQAEATTKEVLEQKVEDPLQEGSGNLADVEKREETGPAPIDAVS